VDRTQKTLNLLRWIVNPWVVGGAIIFALVMLMATLSLLWFTRPERSSAMPATAILNIIPAPTASQPPATPLPGKTPTPSPPVPPSPMPGVISVGSYVQISGTSGDGLRLRTDPSLDSEVRLLGSESEVFQVKEGPKEVDGYTWWYLVGPYDPSRRGWAVSNYLVVVQNPQ
jgi:hypothetical protein